MDNNRKKVLVVDDEPAVRELVRRMLCVDYTVLEARNGEEALGMASSQKPDLILMDVMMPEMDGLSACHEIKKNHATARIPVVMLTAVGYELNRKFAEDVIGADGYVTKPFARQDLQQAIERAFGRPGGEARPS